MGTESGLETGKDFSWCTDLAALRYRGNYVKRQDKSEKANYREVKSAGSGQFRATKFSFVKARKLDRKS